LLPGYLQGQQGRAILELWEHNKGKGLKAQAVKVKVHGQIYSLSTPRPEAVSAGAVSVQQGNHANPTSTKVQADDVADLDKIFK
jgi:hypothetical protein